MKIKGISERELLMIGVGLLLGRVHVLEMNPFAIGFFLAMCMEQVPRIWYFIGLEFGILSVYGWQQVCLYGAIMLACWLLCQLLEKRWKLLTVSYSIIGAFVTYMVKNFGQAEMMVGQRGHVLLLLECSLVAIFTMVLHVGIHYILKGKALCYASNEELISVMLLGCLCIFGVPLQNGQAVDLQQLCLALFILLAAYKYGAGAGTMAGAVGGLFYLVEDQSMEMLGILSILGLAVGMFRELGRMAAVITYLTIYSVSGIYFENQLLAMGKLWGILLAGIMFLLIPRRFASKVDGVARESEYQKNWEKEKEHKIKRRLQHFSEPFFALSKNFLQLADQSENVQECDMEHVLKQVGDCLCQHCEKKNRCLGYTRHKKYRTIGYLLPVVQEQGFVTEEDFPVSFLNKCDYVPQYVAELNRALQLSYQDVQWRNRLAESRAAMGEQFHEIGSLLKEISEEISTEHLLELEEERELKMILKRNQILASRIERIENNQHQKEIHMQVRARRKCCITSREVAKCISQALCEEYVPSARSKHVLSEEYEALVLVEDTKYRIITGVARKCKQGESSCGDNFSCMKLESGQQVLALADGMGSGEKACVDSSSVVELLEQFLEVGLGEKSALHLINSVMLLQSDNQSFSTMDMVVIDLYQGSCDFVKMGASTAFIKNFDGVESISSTSLPMGVMPRANWENVTRKLEEESYIILLSDGVLETARAEDKEEYYRERIMRLDLHNPQEIADTILAQAIGDNHGEIVDDMTVLVARVWIK